MAERQTNWDLFETGDAIMNAFARTTTIASLLFLGVLSAGLALAQSTDSTFTYPCGQGYLVYPRVYPYWGAGTVAGDYARGLAALTHAQGVYNRLSAEARLLHADAYARELQNHQASIQSYFEMRKLNQETRAAQRGPRLTTEQLSALAERRRPAQLDPAQLDPATGAIAWPIVLQGADLANLRSVVDAAFSRRASQGSLSTADVERVQQATEALQAALKQRIRQLPATEYIAAKQFLSSLAFEVRQPLG